MSVSSVGLASNQYQWPTFSSTDTDGDGALSLSEFGAVGQNVQGGSNGLDSDSIQQIFSAIDTDGDGKISKSEATSAFDKLSSALQSGLLGAQEQFGGPPPPPPSDGNFFASADTDGSGGLSFDEFKAAAPPDAPALSDDQLKTMFDKLDTNGDGVVSQDEMKAAHKGHHHHAEGPPPADQSADSSSDASCDASAGGSTTSSADASTSASSTSSLSDLFLQAVQAYSGTSQSSTQNSAANIVSQILDTLKAV